MNGLLLDTCAALWLMNGDTLPAHVIDAIDGAAGDGQLWISAVTGWEVALKARPGRPDSPIVNGSVEEWYDRLVGLPGVREMPLTGKIALASASLPPLHGDPADRFLIATAIELGAPLVTTDQRIMAYAKAGIVEVLPC